MLIEQLLFALNDLVCWVASKNCELKPAMLVEDILHNPIPVATALQSGTMVALTNRHVLRRPDVEPLVA